MNKPSFTAVNYSLRPSKTIQRSLVFDGLRRLQEILTWDNAAYLGFGSIWFTDFILAHRTLGLERMISVEENLIGFRRATFNRPYKFVQVIRGKSFDVLPKVFAQARFRNTPTILWLDYDSELSESIIDELRWAVDNAKDDSVLLVTVDATEKLYGITSRQRLDRLTQLFGERSTRSLDRDQVSDIKLSETLGSLIMSLFKNYSRRIAKQNAIVPAFQIPYQDKASMVTIGAVFPRQELFRRTREKVQAPSWGGFVTDPIVAPHLTSKEVAVLQGNLPSRDPLTRQNIRDLGFDLEIDQLRVFQEHYRRYPTFAQVLS